MKNFHVRQLARLAASALIVAASELPASELATLQSGSNPDDAYGYAIAAAGTRVAVSAPGTDTSRGVVFVYDCANVQCVLDGTLSVPSLAEGARFGTALAMEGDRIAISAPNSGIGEVFVFDRMPGGWIAPPQIVPGLVFASGGRFGAAIAMSNDTLLVGADDQESGRGVAYVLRDGGGKWLLEQTLRPADRAPGDRFGAALAIDGETAMVASPYAKAGGDTGEYARGEVAVYARNANVWTRTQVLRAVVTDDAARYGFALALSGDHAVIGAPGDDRGTGRVYGYQRSVGVFSAQSNWVPLDAGMGDSFGWAIALRDNRLLVAAPFAGELIDECGRVSSYLRSGNVYTELAPLRARSMSETALFGFSLSIGTPGEFASTPAPLGRAGLAHYFNAAESVFDADFEIELGPCFAPDLP